VVIGAAIRLVSIPLAVYDKVLASTVGLSEMGMRFPVLLAGGGTLLPRLHARPNNWTNHGWFPYAYDPARLGWRCPPEVPRFYRELAAQPAGSLRLLEAPWRHAWENVYFPCYQQVHRQYMAIGFVAPRERAASASGLPRAAELPLLAPGAPFRFRNFVHVADDAGLRRRAIRYVVFHRSLEAAR
jgi:hypothetical protein